MPITSSIEMERKERDFDGQNLKKKQLKMARNTKKAAHQTTAKQEHVTEYE